MRAVLTYLHENLLFLLCFGSLGAFVGVLLMFFNAIFLAVTQWGKFRLLGISLEELNTPLTLVIGIFGGFLIGIFRVGREREEQQLREEARKLD